MTDFAVTLQINKAGDREALQALDALTRKGREVVETVSGQTGRAMGDVAVAYQSGSASIKRALEDISDGHKKVVREMQAQERQAGTLATRQASHALAGARSMEALARATSVTGDALNGVIAQGSQLALGFGTAGPIVGAIGIATLAIVEMFQRASREAKKTVDDIAQEFGRIAHMGVVAQGEQAALLFSGDPNATDPMRANSLAELRRQRDMAAQRSTMTTIRGGPGGVERVLSEEAKGAAEELKKLNAEIQRRNDLLTSIVGVNGRGGSLERAALAGQSADQAGFVTAAMLGDRKDQRSELAKAKEQAAWLARAIARQTAEEVKRAKAEMIDDLQASDAARTSIWAELVPSKEEIAKFLKEAAANVKAAIEEDPFLEARRAFDRAVKSLARTMKDALGQSLSEGIAAGLEAAFSAKGIGNAFKTLTSTILAALGGFMIALGGQMIVVGLALDALAKSLLSLNGPAAIAAGVGLIAAGAALRAVAGSFGGNESGAGASSGAGGGYSAPDFLTFPVRDAATPTTSRSAPTEARQFNQFFVIGPADPQAQRAIGDIVGRADRRGLISWAP